MPDMASSIVDALRADEARSIERTAVQTALDTATEAIPRKIVGSAEDDPERAVHRGRSDSLSQRRDVACDRHAHAQGWQSLARGGLLRSTVRGS